MQASSDWPGSLTMTRFGEHHQKAPVSFEPPDCLEVVALRHFTVSTCFDQVWTQASLLRSREHAILREK